MWNLLAKLGSFLLSLLALIGVSRSQGKAAAERDSAKEELDEERKLAYQLAGLARERDPDLDELARVSDRNARPPEP